MKKIWIFPLVILLLAAAASLVYFVGRPNISTIERWVMSVPRGSQTPDEQKTLGSLEVVNDHPLYQMTFYGDYPRYLQMKKRFYWAMGFPEPHCTSFAALNPEGHTILGYNNDMFSPQPILLLFTHPTDGYASISISDIGGSVPGFTKSRTPFDSDFDRSLLLYAPYSTQTGMNEMGLAVSTMNDPQGSWKIDPEKDTVGAAEARRLILDHARDVEDAISLLSQRNVSYVGTSVSHLLIADRLGHSAILEWVDGEMKVTRNQQPWQVSTNFRVYGADEIIKADLSQYQAGKETPEDSCARNHWRYATAWETLRKAGGLLSPQQSMDLLQTVSFANITQFSIVYDLTTGEVQIVTDRNYPEAHHYQLEMK